MEGGGGLVFEPNPCYTSGEMMAIAKLSETDSWE